MAGPLDAMIQTFMGQTNSALNEPAAPWQQELLETVNPQKVKTQNIKRALAQASMRLANTPGNFLTGLSAAAGEGANSYLTAQDEAEQQRAKVMQLVSLAQQKDQDRRLSLLHDAIGVSDGIEERNYRRGRDAKTDARQEKLDDSLIDYRNRPRNSGSAADSAIERRRGRAADAYFKQLDKLRENNYGDEPSEEQKDALKEEIMRMYNIDGFDGEEGAPSSDAPPGVAPAPSSPTVPSDTVSAPTSGSILPAPTPPPLDQRRAGQTYEVPGKGKFTWTGSGWKPVI